MNLPNKKQLIGPEEGWEAHTYYVVESSYSSHNPINRRIFYSGFLSEEGQPRSYDMMFCPWSDDPPGWNSVYYLKVIEKFAIDTPDGVELLWRRQ